MLSTSTETIFASSAPRSWHFAFCELLTAIRGEQSSYSAHFIPLLNIDGVWQKSTFPSIHLAVGIQLPHCTCKHVRQKSTFPSIRLAVGIELPHCTCKHVWQKSTFPSIRLAVGIELPHCTCKHCMPIYLCVLLQCFVFMLSFVLCKLDTLRNTYTSINCELSGNKFRLN
jgi:hypothetical protein